MSFYGCSFIYDGIPSEEFGLMIYDFGSVSQDDGSVGTELTILEDRIQRRSTPIHYGIVNNTPLQFNLVFGSLEPLDRFDVAAVAGWLCGHSLYKPFMVVQPDMAIYHYKAIIVNLDIIPWSGSPVAFNATLICDSPFAYMQMDDWIASCDIDTLSAVFDNRSNVNDFYYPERFEVTYSALSLRNTDSLSISNESTGETILFNGLSKPGILNTISIDSRRQIVSSSDGTNLYSNFNFVFPRFRRGHNTIVCDNPDISITISRDFPMNIGF